MFSTVQKPLPKYRKSARYGESAGVIARGMYEERRTGTWEAQHVPSEYLTVEQDNKQGGLFHDMQGVGSAHSTRRTGEPSTGGRG